MKFIPLVALPLQALAFSPTTRFAQPAPLRSPSYVRSMTDTDIADTVGYTPGQKTVYFEDEAMGEGDGAVEGDVVVVKFVGRVMATNKQFINSDAFPFEIGEGKSLPGFDEAMVGVKVGGKRNLKVPPSKAYGPQGSGRVPPNADLEFDCEVLTIARNPVEKIWAKIGLQRALVFSFSLFLLVAAPNIEQVLNQVKSNF